MGLGLGIAGPRGPVFADMLSEEQRERLIALGHIRHVKERKEVFQAGDESDGLYLIEDGVVQITLASPNDKGMVVNRYGPGDIFGEMGVLDKLPRSANAVARTDTTLYFIRAGAFIEYVKKDPEVSIMVMEILTHRLRRTSESLSDALFLGLEPRLAKALLELAETHGVRTEDGIQISMAMSQYEIGQTIAFSRESTNKMLNKWQKMGLVTHADGKVTIHDPDRLADLIDNYD